jgi:hypothetical protein
MLNGQGIKESGTFGVRVELAYKDYKLPAGLKGKVQFLGN